MVAGGPGPNAWLTSFTLTAPPIRERDTIRGGLFLVFAAPDSLVDTTRDRSLLSTSLPAGWNSLTSGSGGVRPTLAGLELDTGVTAGSVAGLESTDAYLRFDIAVDVELVHPTGATSSAVDLAVLEARTGSGAIARVRLRRGWGTNPALTVGFGDMVPVTGPVLTGGIVDAGARELYTLRIVRHEEYVWGFLGVRSSDGTTYTSLTKVLDFTQFPTDTGLVRFYVSNPGYSARVRSRFTNYTVRSHARVGKRLLDNKVDVSRRRLAGNVPAATVQELGRHDIHLFGLFGEVSFPNGFEYVLPPPKTVGRESARTLFTVQDPILKDGA